MIDGRMIMKNSKNKMAKVKSKPPTNREMFLFGMRLNRLFVQAKKLSERIKRIESGGRYTDQEITNARSVYMVKCLLLLAKVELDAVEIAPKDIPF